MVKQLDVTEVIGEVKFNKFHFGMLFWGSFIVVFDMYDLMVYASILPSMVEAWSLSPVVAGNIGSYGPLGMMVGALSFGYLADRFGRKRLLAIAVVLFSVASTLAAIAPGPTVFGVLRFVAGLGIGGVLPTVIAMLTDYAPKKLKSTFVAILMCAFSVGGILAAFVAMVFIPLLGWQGVYWVAIIPVFALPFMMKYFNDSPARLLSEGRENELRRILGHAAPEVDIPSEAVLYAPQTTRGSKRGGNFTALFQDKRATGTIMIWIAFFMCLLMINGVSTWLPNLMLGAGFELNSSLTFMVALNVGAIVGTLVMGRLADNLGVKRVLVPMFVVSALSLIVLGLGGPAWALLLVVAITGATTMGSQNISYSFASLYYPSEMRSTAVGFASGVGRLGAVVGPTFGGYMLTLDQPVMLNFVGFAIPGIIAAVAFSLVPLKRKSKQSDTQDSELVEETV